MSTQHEDKIDLDEPSRLPRILGEKQVKAIARKHASMKSDGRWYQFCASDLDAFAIDLMRDVLALARKAQEPAVKENWIAVEDQLPPEWELVLTSGAKSVGMAVMQYSERDGWQIETASEWNSSYPPKFWRKLPDEPAKETIHV